MNKLLVFLLCSAAVIAAGCGSTDESTSTAAEFMPNVTDVSLADATKTLDSAGIEWQVDKSEAADDPTAFTVCSSVPEAGSEVDGKTATLLVQEGSKCESAEDQSAPEESAESTAEPDESAAAKRIKVPDVVGMNHQEAQDYLQSKGLYMLDEVDATGEGRMLVWDRNWEVVKQKPTAGKRVTEDTTITLYSKKLTD